MLVPRDVDVRTGLGENRSPQLRKALVLAGAFGNAAELARVAACDVVLQQLFFGGRQALINFGTGLLVAKSVVKAQQFPHGEVVDAFVKPIFVGGFPVAQRGQVVLFQEALAQHSLNANYRLRDKSSSVAHQRYRRLDRRNLPASSVLSSGFVLQLEQKVFGSRSGHILPGQNVLGPAWG